MKRLLFFIALTPLLSFGQTKAFEITYDYSENGKTISNFSVIYKNDIVYLSKKDSKVQSYSDLVNEENISLIQYQGEYFKKVTSFNDLPKASIDDETEKILKYKCKHATYSYFSNNIEVWFSEKTEAKGSPYSRFLPNKNALVLKILINGTRELKAVSIEKIELIDNIKEIPLNANIVEDEEFEELLIKSRFSRISIFNEEVINFDPSLEIDSNLELESNQTYRFTKGSVILKKIFIPDSLLSSGQIFARLQCRSNGDAYDRTGSVFILSPNKNQSMLNAFTNGTDELPIYTDNAGNEYQGITLNNDYDPPIELMRFFTSFGAGHFNDKRAINGYNWSENVNYVQEVTQLIPNDTNYIWIGVFVGNYDKGGHIVNLDLDFHPQFEDEPSYSKSKLIQPLFSTVNTMEMSGQNYGRLFKTDSLIVSFEVKPNTKGLKLLYTSTGHGGWGGGDEFNPKVNQIFIDGKEEFKVIPWRTDCATYRLSNPASGNFGNGTSSSDFSRSNWCPATLTPPYIISLEHLNPGTHEIKLYIDQGDDEGNSFNHWNVSAVLIGETDE